MAQLGLDLAVSHILQACRKPKADQRPFVFVIGAGLSSPVVPLAAEIIDHCRPMAEGYKRVGSQLPTKAIDLYSYWFELAYPHAKERQDYLLRVPETLTPAFPENLAP